MTDLEQLRQIKVQTLALIADITAQPKPTYKIDGQYVGWDKYLGRLQDTVRWCDQQIAAAAPVEVRSQGYS
jgi:hypothetical protein